MRVAKRAGRVHAAFVVVSLLLAAAGIGCSGKGEEASQQEARERDFQESMTGVVLEGHYTLNGREGVREERYEIQEVTKMAGDYWLIHARIQYGSRDVSVPVPVKILWAGDTPVVSLTDAEIPGVGTFTARVLFYGGQYVGTWSSGDHGGQQFGRIVKKTGVEE